MLQYISEEKRMNPKILDFDDWRNSFLINENQILVHMRFYQTK